MSQGFEQRQTFRMPFESKVFCRLEVAGREYQGKLRDMSILGLFMETDDCPPVGAQCAIYITLRSAHSRLTIDKFSGTVIRCNKDGAGVVFDDRLEWPAMVPLYFRKMLEQASG